MAYQALYRAYRPRTFDEVIDQKAIIKTLKNAIINDKVAHAYLFCGPRGTGKTTMAKIFATALNCEEKMTISPCLECDNCTSIIKGNNPDVIELDAASNNGADDIRALRENVGYLPNSCRKKVYIIDEVHMLSQAAFNALLKTLEEPPKYVVFILATTEPHKIPNTILSRCQRFDFKAITDDGLKKRLNYVCEKENIKIEDEAIDKIVLNAEGGMRDALSLLDQVISFSENEVITLKDTLEVCGNTDDYDLFNILNNAHNNEVSKALEVLNDLITIGKEVPKIALDLVNFIRDILLYKNEISILNKPFFKDENYKNKLDEFNSIELFKYIDILNETINKMKFSNQKKPFLEVAIIKLADSLYNEENRLISKIALLEKEIKSLKENNSNNINLVTETKEIKNLKKIYETKEEQKPIEQVELNNVENDKFISVKDINYILNNADKGLKENIIEVQNKIKSTSTNFAVTIFSNGKIVASTKDEFIIVMQDIGFCDRVMKNINYNLILREINNYLKDIKDFYALPNDIWRKIVADFKVKHEKDKDNVVLDYIEIPVLKPEPIVKVLEKDKVIEKLENMFNDILEIKEY